MNATSTTAHDLSPDDPPLSPVVAPTAGGTQEPEAFQHYQVLRREDGSLWELGRGAMGVTYKAFDTNLRCYVALKVISAQHLHSEMAGQRFVREARIAARLRHRNIATVYHLGVDPQSFFYSMEFIDGETLEDLVERAGPLPLETVLHIALQTARALAAASRQGLIHRDLKPANLMVLHQNEEGEDQLLVKVIDFGLARSYAVDDSSPQLTATGFVGTPLYSSPEQLEEKHLDVRSDIYSLGVTLWILLTGRPPFDGKMTVVITQHLTAEPPWWQLGDCPAPARALLERMLHKDREQRYQSAGELRLAIEDCLRGLVDREALSRYDVDPAGPERRAALPGGANSAPRRTTASDAVLSRPPSEAASGSHLREAVAAAGSAVPASDARSAGNHGGRLRWRPSLAGAVAVLLGTCAFVYWHGSSGTANGARPVASTAAKTVPASPTVPARASSALAEPAPTPPLVQPTVVPVEATTPAPPKEEVPTKPLDEQTALAGPPPAPDGTAGAADASASPAAAMPAADGRHDDSGKDNAASPATKNQAVTSRSTHTRRAAKPKPTPAPNFFQKLLGIKPKSKAT